MKPWTNNLNIVRVEGRGYVITHLDRSKTTHVWNTVKKEWQKYAHPVPDEAMIPSHSEAYDWCKQTTEPPK